MTGSSLPGGSYPGTFPSLSHSTLPGGERGRNVDRGVPKRKTSIGPRRPRHQYRDPSRVPDRVSRVIRKRSSTTTRLVEPSVSFYEILFVPFTWEGSLVCLYTTFSGLMTFQVYWSGEETRGNHEPTQVPITPSGPAPRPGPRR